MQVFRQAKTTQSAANDCRFEHQSSSHFRALESLQESRKAFFSRSAWLEHTLTTARQFRVVLGAASHQKCLPSYWVVILSEGPMQAGLRLRFAPTIPPIGTKIDHCFATQH
jgi:hypothetical protein